MPRTQNPASPVQPAANRIDSVKSCGPQSPVGHARSANSREPFAPERMALSQQAMLRSGRIESGHASHVLSRRALEDSTRLKAFCRDLPNERAMTAPLLGGGSPPEMKMGKSLAKINAAGRLVGMGNGLVRERNWPG